MKQSAQELSTEDRKLLKSALDAGKELESWFIRHSATDSTTASTAASNIHSPNDPSLEPLAERFQIALQNCAQGTSSLVQKLSELAPKAIFSSNSADRTRNQGHRHLMALLVPLERLSGRSARDEEFLYTETDALSESKAEAGMDESPGTRPRLVLCENIRSAFNVGAIFRTAETFQATAIWRCGYTPEPTKTAMGTDTLVSSQSFPRTSDAIEAARANGYQIVVLENAPGAIALENFQWPDKAALVLGNERFGVDSQTLAAADHIVRISAQGQKNSLNVGIAFGIAAASWRTIPASHAGATLDGSDKSHGTSSATKAPLAPIGFIRDGYQNPQSAPRQGSLQGTYSATRPKPSTIELLNRFEGRPSNFEQALKDLESFERIWLIFGFHESQGWLPQVRPPRGDGTKRGLFATRAPHRPNGLGLSCVRLDKIEGRTVFISEHDLLEGTPIYDIKPYVPEADAFPSSKAGWVDDIEASAYELHETANATSKYDWLLAHAVDLRAFAFEQLRFQPLDSSRKRLTLEGTGRHGTIGPHHTIAYRTWRLDFVIQEAQVSVLDIRSGYTPPELIADEHDQFVSDPYGDKALHRAFILHFK
ncbi:MAG: tRNA (N6-threonylcarbamoyladenosine(37)-N6)-methyltransferase TrmO [Bdellovibrionales bacterium]|jgi:tRNA-Thr(GGU) m(6)t(6)A37 methyltransferase TsaA|nr:tRNA (N6-threonylcarbamoyladenosine(37)-N6)-methyltransferase TrmO [Bdellovibrionales bacterium]